MSNVELHIFRGNDLNGSPIFTCSDDDTFFEAIELRIALNELGYGKVRFSRQVGQALLTSGVLAKENFARVVIPRISATHYAWGFFLTDTPRVVVSRDENAGEDQTFGGPGPLWYLDRARILYQKFGSTGGRIDADNGVWRFPETYKAGRILNILLEEDASQLEIINGPTFPDGPFLPDLTRTFDNDEDSASNPWTEDFAERFEVAIGHDSILTAGWSLQDACESLDWWMGLGDVGAPLMELSAWEAPLGRDLTGSDFGVDVTLFKEQVNIADELTAGGSGRRKASHVMVRGDDGSYAIAVRPSFDPGDFQRMEYIDAPGISNIATLERRGLRWLRQQDDAENEIIFELGELGGDVDAGKYFPGGWDGTSGDFEPGATLTIKTGTDALWSQLDYHYEPFRLAAITMELDTAAVDDDADTQARSWRVIPEFNIHRDSFSAPQGGHVGAAGRHRHPPNPRLCEIPESSDIHCEDLTLDDLTAVSTPNGDVESGTTGWSGPGGAGVNTAHVFAGSQSYGVEDAAPSVDLFYDFSGTFPEGVRHILDAYQQIGGQAISQSMTFGLLGVDDETVTSRFESVIVDGTTWGHWRVCWTPTADRTGVQVQFHREQSAAAGGQDWAVVDNLQLYTVTEDATSALVGTSRQAARCDHNHNHNDLANRNADNAHIARAVGYANDLSGLDAENMQDAVDEHVTDADAHGGVSDHGALAGLADDDHDQYVLRSILTTKGDIFVRTSSGITRLPVGSDDQILKADSSQPEGVQWVDADSVAGAGGAIWMPLVTIDPVSGESRPVVDANGAWVPTNVGSAGGSSGGGGTTDHGSLSGLADFDHDQYVRGVSGRQYYMLAGIVRKTSGTWSFINDASHRPMGFASISADSDKISLTPTNAWSRVASAVATIDETWISSYMVGVRVASGNVELWLTDLDGNPVNPGSVANDSFANIWVMAIMEV